MRIVWRNRVLICQSLMRVLKKRQNLMTFGSMLGLLGYIFFVHDSSDPRSSGELRAETAKLIFVDGYPSSGTTLMRVLLDAHPAIRCGAEPVITEEVIVARTRISQQKSTRLIQAGIFPEAYDKAVAAFVLNVLQYMGPPAEWLCHKQPQTLIHMEYLSKIFPRAMFVHILRDGRAAVASSVERRLFGLSAEKILESWEKVVTIFLKACQNVGSQRCMTVRYEKLVLEPETEMRPILEFLGIPWDPIVLHHETILGNLTHLNEYEPSTKQVKRAIHEESLAKWASPNSILPRDFIQTAGNKSRLLARLGYLACGIPPNYDRLSSSVPHID